jgi:glutaryl-CoA dehydrogenase
MTQAAFQWDDPLLLDQQLSSDERIVRDAARSFAQDSLAPRVLEAFRSESPDRGIFREMGSLGFLGAMVIRERVRRKSGSR